MTMSESISDLKGKIKKMEEGLNNPNITGQAKTALQSAVDKAKNQLIGLERSQKEGYPPLYSSKSPVPKKMTKKAFYEEADKSYPDLTRNGLNEMPQNKYDGIYSQLMQVAQGNGLSKKEARDYVDGYISRHLPAGQKKAKLKAEKETEKPVKKEAANPVYSWKSKVEPSKLQPVILHCQHYSIPIKKETPVRLKGTGNESIDVIAKPGEHMIFDDKGYPVFIMNKGSFERKCNEGTTVDAHEETKHLAEKAKKLEEELQKAQSESTDLKEKVKEAAEAHQKEIKSLKDQLEQKKEHEKAPGKKEGKKQVAQKPSSKGKKPVCTLEDAETGRRVAKVTKFFLDEAEDWNNSKSTRKITKVMRTKGDNQDVIIEVADYRGFATGLATLIGGSRKYYRLCVDSFNLTAVDKPKPGTYSVVIPSQKMKEVYTTKGSKQYKICLQSYRELLKCSFEGSCTNEQQKKWKTLYQECGDLVAKLDKNPQVLKDFHVEVKKRRKPEEKYSDAMSRVAAEIKKESA